MCVAGGPRPRPPSHSAVGKVDIIQLDTGDRRGTQNLEELADRPKVNFRGKIGHRYVDHMPVAVADKSVGVAARLEVDPSLPDPIDVAALHADHERGGGGGLHGELQFASRVSEGRQVVFYVRRKSHSSPTEAGRSDRKSKR